MYSIELKLDMHIIGHCQTNFIDSGECLMHSIFYRGSPKNFYTLWLTESKNYKYVRASKRCIVLCIIGQSTVQPVGYYISLFADKINESHNENGQQYVFFLFYMKYFFQIDSKDSTNYS